jgi:hypothetical protein
MEHLSNPFFSRSYFLKNRLITRTLFLQEDSEQPSIRQTDPQHRCR